MSELTNKQNGGSALRWNLLATVSALALLGGFNDAAKASDDDSGRPVVWIELGGELNRVDESQQRLAPPFVTSIVSNGFASPLSLERLPLYGIGENAKVSFQPEDSSWVFSASVRYGRSSGKGYRHQQTNRLVTAGIFSLSPTQARFRYAETKTANSETHDILDFMVGKDIGLGALGSSVFSGGIRFVQFRSKSSAGLYADPDYVNPNKDCSFNACPGGIVGPKYFHNFDARSTNKTSFIGFGPTISWDASAPLLGQAQGGRLTLDWGLNGAVLFGRQKSAGYHQTDGKLTTGLLNFPQIGKYYNTKHYTHSYPHNRSRMVAVPNIGAMAGLSFHYANAKVSFGYRADMFFGAMDGGIDTAKKENVGFYGPFASVSIGLGG